MIVDSRTAIRANEHWKGTETQAIAMLLTMLDQMEAQYQSQIHMAKEREKAARKQAEKEIREAGGITNGVSKHVEPKTIVN